MKMTERLDQFHRLVQETVCTVAGRETPCDTAITAIHTALRESRREARRVFLVGNGGSAGLVSHHAVDLVNVMQVAAIPLVEPGLLTCMGNDYGYEQCFARPLESLAAPQDLLIAVSSSGRSPNILRACEVMRGKGGQIITYSGFAAENPLRQLGDINIWTGQADYGLVEAAHFFLLHTIIDTWPKGQ